MSSIRKFWDLCRCARCRLQNVKVLNKGVDWDCGSNIYWKHDVHRLESLKIILHGNAEFDAIDVTFEVNIRNIVPLHPNYTAIVPFWDVSNEDNMNRDGSIWYYYV